MKLKYKKLLPQAVAPQYETLGAACFDLYAATVNGSAEDGERVSPHRPVIVDTGLAFEVPSGYMLAIRSRSGLFFKHGVMAFHGTIDSDYRGSVKIKLYCPALPEGTNPVMVWPGDRIAQGCLIPCPFADLEEVAELTDTARGAGGFGSTGGTR
jgi:dUTP pyrophosphatase